MATERLHAAVAGFDGSADAYQRGRPEYPVEAVAWMAERSGIGAGRHVVDLAAGTGKLTAPLAATGAALVAVEPVDGMRRALRARLPAVPVVAAVAEALPFGEGAADVVTVGQGFHWFATTTALDELHRVLRPGGSLVLVWNRRDEASPLQSAISRLVNPHRADTPSFETGRWRDVLDADGRFDDPEETQIPWRHPSDADAVADRVGSVSFIASMAEAERRRLLDQVRAAVRADPGGGELAYVTLAYVFRRR